ncbi:MAG: phosphoglucosamine mutase [Candidatus Kapaibacterium sp.]|nr:phosphoglucosamine mutase [Ignavibacteriota bacterium]MCB9220288.1 phosphoglucosamine mutase [Ignavibacteria bacterium]
MPIIRSISGIRATLNDGLRPDILTKYVAAYCNAIPKGDIVVGRDGRPSGKWISELVCATINACGRNVKLLDICPTPTVQLITEKTDAVGGISITASHNPEQWNGLKFLNQEGVFLNKEENERFWILFDTDDIEYSINPSNEIKIEKIDSLQKHIDAIVNSDLFDVVRIKSQLESRKFKIVVDAVNASGSTFVPQLLKVLGCEVIELFTDNSGIFPHTPEPITENLGQLCQSVIDNSADLGIAVDPDADRLVLIDENGDAIGEEKTIAIAVKSALENNRLKSDYYENCITVNLSTSGMTEKIASIYDAVVERSAVGEINVVSKMKENKSLVGGEGSGGVILPHIHYGRDSLVGITLLLDIISSKNLSLSELSNSLPVVFMIKDKIEINSNPNELMNKLKSKFTGYNINTEDGIRIRINDNEWVHIRISNTEPIVRIITESNTRARAKEIFDDYKTILQEIS